MQNLDFPGRHTETALRRNDPKNKNLDSPWQPEKTRIRFALVTKRVLCILKQDNLPFIQMWNRLELAATCKNRTPFLKPTVQILRTAPKTERFQKPSRRASGFEYLALEEKSKFRPTESRAPK